MSSFRVEAEPLVETDIESSFEWYELELPGLGQEFLEEVRTAYLKIMDGPLKYEKLRSGVRRALTKRFPYAIYFVVEGQVIVILAILHCARDPAEWQWRI